MNKGLIISGVVALGVLLLGGSCMGSYVSTRQTYVGFETDINAQDKEMQNVDTEVTNSLQTQGLAVGEYKDLVVNAIKVANSGRYGADGSKAMMQWIKEQNPTIDSDIFKKIMVAAESGYAKFAAAQRKKIDLARVYRKSVEQEQQVPIWGSIVTSGFPRKSWDELERVIVSEDTAKTWKTGIKQRIDPFKK
jgi:hypothetical protein